MIRLLQCEDVMRKLGDADVRLVEVSSTAAYDEAHLPGAISLPLERLKRAARTFLPDRGVEVIVYSEKGADPACSGALRILESLGYFNLGQYSGGKEEWQARGNSVVAAH